VIQWLNEQAPASGGAEGAEEVAFATLLDGDCAGTLRLVNQAPEELSEPGRTLYRGAAWACLAAFDGHAELWPRAEAAYEQTSGQASVLSCESRTVRYRYDGLRLVQRSGDRYLLMSEQSDARTSRSIVLRETDAVRMEFSRDLGER
jgi:hypothetical protein